ncbi:DUF5685 family protein [Acutalibacter muris]|uniref:DUF5685 family protein n=1 Tax=Acutalibacter muris TaxID=1796620 RepID=UPI00272ABDD7|nr:DUF5685 family protein [Acutalibacter muris]
MFGYVRPYKPELLVKEYGQYKAVYCELCRVLGKEYGAMARFALSYDCAFYALLALSVGGERVEERSGRCVFNPLKPCTYLQSPGEAYKKAAALCVLLTYHKLRDDCLDEGFFSSLGSRLLLPIVSPKARRAAKRYPSMAGIVERTMEEQRQAERESAGVDRCAEPTASLLRGLFGELAGCDGKQRPALESFGYFLGRWVYLMDAADDLAEDMRRGSFNPFIKRLGLEGRRELSQEERGAADKACNEALNATAARLVLAVNLIDLGAFGPIIENVAQKGLGEVQREILFLHVKEKPRREPR